MSYTSNSVEWSHKVKLNDCFRLVLQVLAHSLLWVLRVCSVPLALLLLLYSVLF